jgi:hypothetical protein
MLLYFPSSAGTQLPELETRRHRRLPLVDSGHHRSADDPPSSPQSSPPLPALAARLACRGQDDVQEASRAEREARRGCTRSWSGAPPRSLEGLLGARRLRCWCCFWRCSCTGLDGCGHGGVVARLGAPGRWRLDLFWRGAAEDGEGRGCPMLNRGQPTAD